MNEKVRKGIVYAALLGAIIYGGNQFLFSKVEVQPNPNATIAPVQAGMAGRSPVVEKTINVAEMKNKQWGDDPFRAILKSSAKKISPSQPSWKLTGIVYNSNKPLAVINGKSVSVGDNVGDAKVVEIGRKSVIIERAGARITLTVSKG